MSRTELNQYQSYSVRYRGEICLEEAEEREAFDFIDREVESGKDRNDFELVKEDVVEIIPPQKTSD